MKLFSLVVSALFMTALCAAGEEKLVAFGEITKGENGGDELRETTVISLKKELSYGWIARAKPGAEKVKFKETLRVPPSGYNYDGKKVESPKTVFETEKEVAVVQGKFGHKWRPSETDPGGKYEIVIEVDGKIVFSSTFLLLPP